MGYVNTEQTVEIIEAVAEAVNSTPVQQEPNYWWLLLIGVIPAVIPFFLNRKKTLSKKGKK